MRNLAKNFGICAISVAMGGTLAIPAAAESLSIRFGTGHPQNAVEYNIAAHEYFVPELKRRAKEAGIDLEVQELYGGTVAKLTEVFEATRDGLLDIGVWGAVFEPTDAFLQAFNFYLPFNSPDAMVVTEASRRTFDKFPELRNVFEEKHNQKWLGMTCVGNYGLGTNFAWDTVEDLKGHKIAGAGANLNWIVGATPVASNLNEAYQAIQSGVYEGYIIFAGSWFGFKLHEVGKHFMKTDFGTMSIMAVTMNLDTWKKLSPEMQEIVQQTVIDYEQETAKICNQFSIDGEKKLIDAGVTVKQLADDQKTAWCELLRGWPNEMAKEAANRGLPGVEVMSYYVQTVGELGHKFPCEYPLDGK